MRSTRLVSFLMMVAVMCLGLTSQAVAKPSIDSKEADRLDINTTLQDMSWKNGGPIYNGLIAEGGWMTVWWFYGEMNVYINGEFVDGIALSNNAGTAVRFEGLAENNGWFDLQIYFNTDSNLVFQTEQNFRGGSRTIVDTRSGGPIEMASCRCEGQNANNGVCTTADCNDAGTTCTGAPAAYCKWKGAAQDSRMIHRRTGRNKNSPNRRRNLGIKATRRVLAH